MYETKAKLEGVPKTTRLVAAPGPDEKLPGEFSALPRYDTATATFRHYYACH